MIGPSVEEVEKKFSDKNNAVIYDRTFCRRSGKKSFPIKITLLFMIGPSVEEVEKKFSDKNNAVIYDRTFCRRSGKKVSQ
jgi:cytochrome c551/c552